MIFASDKYTKRLRSIKKGVAKRFNKGGAADWRNRDFEDLSFEIRKTSKVLISAATLKRIFGKNKTAVTYYPQESTLEALENYAGKELTTSSNNRTWLAASIPIGFILIGIVLLLLFTFNKDDKSMC